MDFSGRVLLLTGASGGIGAAIAQLFYERGASVLLADVKESAVRDLARALDPPRRRNTSTSLGRGSSVAAPDEFGGGWPPRVARRALRGGKRDRLFPRAAPRLAPKHLPLDDLDPDDGRCGLGHVEPASFEAKLTATTEVNEGTGRRVGDIVVPVPRVRDRVTAGGTSAPFEREQLRDEASVV